MMASRGVPAAVIRSMLSLHLAYREHSPEVVSGWVEVLGGQAPVSFDAFARRHAERFRGPAGG